MQSERAASNKGTGHLFDGDSRLATLSLCDKLA